MDRGFETDAAFRAEPNVTGVPVSPVLGPYGSNQISTALNAAHHVGLPHWYPNDKSAAHFATVRIDLNQKIIQ